MKGESNGQAIWNQVSSFNRGKQRMWLRRKWVPWGQGPSGVREEREHTIRAVRSYPCVG